MSAFETNCRTGPDGTLHLLLPAEFANMNLHVSVEPVKASNGTTGPSKISESWKEFIDRYAGSMPDFPDLERPGPEDYEVRDWL